MRITLLAAMLMAVAGCAEAEERPAGPAAAVQEGSEGAEAFVRSVYASYRDEEPWPIDEARLDEVFSPRMAGLIRRDRALADGELPYLDADPICSCQDFEDIRVLRARVSRDGEGRVVVTVRFVNGGEETTTAFRMAGNPNRGWRIDDILDAGDGSSLAGALEASNRRVEQGGRALHRD